MDKFAKRGAIAAVSLIVISGLLGAVGLYRVSSKLEQNLKLGGAPPQLAAALAFPAPAVEVTLSPALPKEAVSAAKPPDLASAFGAALGVDPSKVASRAAAPASSAATAQHRAGSSETLELGFAASERNAKLGNRDAKAFDVRQNGGSQPERKEQPRERVSFETDLARPGL